MLAFVWSSFIAMLPPNDAPQRTRPLRVRLLAELCFLFLTDFTHFRYAPAERLFFFGLC